MHKPIFFEKLREVIASAKADKEPTGKVFYDKAASLKAGKSVYKRRPAEKPQKPEDKEYPHYLAVRGRRLMRKHDLSVKRKMNARYRKNRRKVESGKQALLAAASVLQKGEAYWEARGQGGMYANVLADMSRRLQHDEAARFASTGKLDPVTSR